MTAYYFRRDDFFTESYSTASWLQFESEKPLDVHDSHEKQPRFAQEMGTAVVLITQTFIGCVGRGWFAAGPTYLYNPP